MLNGITLVVASNEMRKNPIEVGDVIVDKEIDWTFLTPMLAAVIDTNKLRRLKQLIIVSFELAGCSDQIST